ncbi:MAG: lysophospholipase [Saprospiraceae bacterium]|nr:lysophospholipase [Saprospiraceae bacterium]
MDNLSWQSATGLKLHAQCWAPSMPVKAVVALVHGMGEHIGRYEHVAQFFNQKGIAVIAYDQQGHGKSEGTRGHIVSVTSLLDDVGKLLGEVEKRFPGKPVFLYGHSMGGNAVLNFALLNKPKVAGIIATSPWIQLAFKPSTIKVLAGRLVNRISPTLSLVSGLDTQFLSHDPAVVKAYNEDPLVHGKISAGGGVVLLDLAQKLDTAVAELGSPLLLTHGSGDKITSHAASYQFALRAKGDVTFREWPGLYHELHNELEKESYLNFLYAWMVEKITP